MTPEAHRRLGHALQAIHSIQTYTADSPWPQLDSWLEACARLRDWQDPVPLGELVGFVAGDLQVRQELLSKDKRPRGRGGEVGSADWRESEEVGI